MLIRFSKTDLATHLKFTVSAEFEVRSNLRTRITRPRPTAFQTGSWILSNWKKSKRMSSQCDSTDPCHGVFLR